jgi:hypothetical protein
MPEDDALSDVLNDATPELLAAVSAVAPNGALASRIRKATEGRVAAEILAPVGLEAVRELAAAVGEACDVEADEALDAVLDAMRARIGDRPGQRLNSLALIGTRMAAAIHDGESGAYVTGNHQETRP